MNIVEIAVRVLSSLPVRPPKDPETVIAGFPADEQSVVRCELRNLAEFYEPQAIAASVIAVRLRREEASDSAIAYRAAAFVYDELASSCRYFGGLGVAVSSAEAADALGGSHSVAERALECAVKLGLIGRTCIKKRVYYQPLPRALVALERSLTQPTGANLRPLDGAGGAPDGTDWIL